MSLSGISLHFLGLGSSFLDRLTINETGHRRAHRDEVEKMIKAKAYRIAIAIGSVMALIEAIGAPVKIKGWL